MNSNRPLRKLRRSGRNDSAGKTGMTRRRFVKESLAAAAFAAMGCGVAGRSAAGFEAQAAGAAPEAGAASIPRAPFGKTGAQVSILGLGTACLGHKNNNNPELPELISVFSEAIDRGVNYVDTARIYGRAEEALGQVLKTRRDKVFLVSKVWADTAEEAEKSFEETVAKLGQEHLDILHLHSCGNRDVDKVLGEGGAWGVMQKLKKAGKVRFVGLTGHSKPANFVRIIEETREVDALMVAMNFVDYHIYGFEEKVLPAARRHQVGVMCMKVFGGIQGGFKNYPAKKPFPAQMESSLHFDSIRYAKSLEGVAGMVIGVHTSEQLRQNIAGVLAAKPLSAEELAALRARGKDLAAAWGPRFGPVA